MSAEQEKPKMTEAQKSTRNLRLRVFFLMAVFGAIMFIPLAMQLYDVQVNRHDDLESKAIGQQTRRMSVSANRGSIYDRKLSILASSGSAETVGIDPPNIESDEQAQKIAKGLADILGLDYEWVLEKTTHKNTSNMTIAVKIEKEKSDQVREFIKTNSFERMIKLDPDSKRYYTYSNLASHIIGFVGRDNTGLDGLEAKYDKYLIGTPGHTISSIDREGRILPDQYEMFYDAQDGQSLVLTIDETVQHIVERHLETALLENEVANRGCAIVMDVKTGGIIAMATKGDYDLNNYQEIADESVLEYLSSFEGQAYQEELAKARQAQWRNKAVSDTYEPGSTFKIITSSIAIETGKIDLENDRFYCSGVAHNIGGFDIRCHKAAGHGSQTLKEAIQNSCNPAFIAIANKIGTENFYKMMGEFGYMDRTNVDIMGEASNKGLYHTWDVYNRDVSTQATYSFGQTFKITPIQMITAVSAVANGGYLMQPYVVSDTIDADGMRSAVNTPKVVRQVISSETSKIMRDYLENAVKNGTGRNAQVTGYRIAGKTGTSQKRDLRDADGNDIGQGKYVVSFVGFAPADDPQIAVLVMLDEPGLANNLRTGGYMSAPVARRIFADALPYLGIAPHYTSEELSMLDIATPDVTGKALEAAKDALEEKKMSYRVIGKGDTVLAQVPASGVKLPVTAEVLLYTESEAPAGTVVMPDVTGLSPEKANEKLGNAGLFMRATGAIEAAAAQITAAYQTVEAGVEIPLGTVVEIEFRDKSVDDKTYIAGE
ncbi:MAG: PASTA domain-containing protein [Oscillospiraceae bacterium]|jgi:stage V sporulation protein D (sporulation-specific penicillin-binding protein)|nr:PASTA domain-containing protein [Oscillospiraceae bacterium]